MGLRVYSSSCKNCLLTKNRLVSPQRAKDILSGCKENQTHFICHKATMEDEEIVCSTFYTKLGEHSQMVRIAKRLNMIEFVEQPDSEQLPTYNEVTTIL